LYAKIVVLFIDVQSDENPPRNPRAEPIRRRGAPVRRVVNLLLVILVAAVLADVLVGDQGLLAMMRARRQYDALSGAIARQRAENARLRTEAERLRDDPAAIEELARRELGFIKPGEKVFIIKDLPAEAKQPVGAP
jgi:cell division protein FtsB